MNYEALQFGKLNNINEKLISFYNCPPEVTTISYIKHALHEYCLDEHEVIVFCKSEEFWFAKNMGRGWILG